ncbi:DNA translocase FtsK [Acidipila sp. EB88]|uniref:DNA translocase FtsK n=1 Tax=Acidipila sp. EB88 TaxID=2305226 RepID=UPI000F5F69BD|nr:DNA translocase FtsK [Acidipila sp. EB88]RRA48791.1 DNA translocase FtsK [Acidipila sp. EB88]
MRSLALVVTPTRNRRLNELVGLVLLLVAALLVLALLSYRSGDPSLDTAGARAVHNWTGRVGASISDLLFQIEGAAAFALPLLLSMLGWSWMRSRATSAPWIKLAGVALAVVVLPAVFALLPWNLHLFGALPIGGVVGTLLLDALTAWINYPGACVLLLFLAAICVYLLTAFTFTSARQWLLVHSAPLAAMRDRWHHWRRGRARRKAERRAAKVMAREARATETAQAEPEQAPYAAPDEAEYAVEPAPARSMMAPAPDGPAPGRRGSFAEMHEPYTTVADGWDDEAFAAEVGSPIAAAESFEELEDEIEEAPLRPQLVALPPRRPVAMVEEAAPLQAADGAVETAEFAVLPATPFDRVPALAAPAQAAESGSGIRFAQRADANERHITMTAKTVNGFESAFKLPPTTLLTRSEEHTLVREEALRAEAQVLVEKCGEFDVGGQVVQINPGPVVTTFEFRPEAGVKYSRVTGLAEDLCLAMAAESILIERMAGKSTVGIQVPNSERETIWLRDIIEAEGFATSKSKITMAMGKDINGKVVVADLATMPHVLIAGSTGSGKSVAINAMIMSVLFKATPEQVRLILVDPKRVELGMYEGIPHLFTPIITEPKLAANALKNAVREMERRLKLLASRSVRNIDQYNRLFDTQPTLWDEQGVEEKPLPYIMIIIDELADLMILDKSNVEEAITRLAQMARAVGIHLILATQRPSVDVITGLIKANVPTRMSFRLATKIDSRTILDTNGAESLLGRGDMLFLPPGTSRLVRVHAPFVTEKETAAVVSFWKAQADVQYAEGFLDAPKDANGREIDGDGAGGGADENDPLFDDAVRLVFEFGKASTSLLQRRMRIGYGRAAALIDMMERDGLVGPPEGSKPRELLKPASWLNESDEALR